METTQIVSIFLFMEMDVGEKTVFLKIRLKCL